MLVDPTEMIGVRELQTSFKKVLDRLDSGELDRMVIMKYGLPRAVLVSYKRYDEVCEGKESS